MLKRLSDNETEGQPEINLAPLIDCLFILLIFFITTTAFIEETGITVSKPETSTSVSLNQKSILLAISSDGRIYYGGKEIGLAGVGSIVRRLCAEEALPVVIQADENVSHGIFSKVYSEAKSAGAKEVSFSTKY